MARVLHRGEVSVIVAIDRKARELNRSAERREMAERRRGRRTLDSGTPKEKRVTRIATRTLTCGMTVVIEPMAGVRSCALTWLLPAGAAHDPEDRLGLSALWAELLMRGAGGLDSRAHADACDTIGMSRSAECGPLFLRISATMLGDRLLDGLPLLADMVRRPRFDPDSLEPARELALMGIEALKDEPQERCSLLARTRHHPTPLNRSVLGTVEGLGAITQSDVVDGWATRAVPEGSLLGIAGAVDVDRTVDALERLTSGWRGSRQEPALGPTPARVYHHEQDDTASQVQILLMTEGPADPDSNSLLERIAASVLSGGMSGRLFTEVREKRGLCYSVSASYAADKRYGTLVAYVGTTPERAQESLDVLSAELGRIRSAEGRVSEDEFRRAIVGMKSGVVFSGESTGARAAAIVSDYYRRGHARSLGEIAAEIDRVTLDDVNGYLAARQNGAFTIQTLGPKALTPPS
ncbi:MAG: insulinase family protein [Phycisphaeraceae bacterium]|nr:insulinase family protein [Phycisphaeraceae bacterium]